MPGKTDSVSTARANAAPALAAWKLPPIIAAIAVSIVLGFYLGGPGLGMAVGALAAATIVVMAVRHPPRRALIPAAAVDSRWRLLVVVETAIAEPGARAIAGLLAGARGDGAAAEVLLATPRRSGFLERWASDLEPGRRRAQADLDECVARLAELGIDAAGVVGDEDAVQLTEDVLRGYAASEVALAAAGGEGRLAAELRDRLTVAFHEVPARRAADAEAILAPAPRRQPRRTPHAA